MKQEQNRLRFCRETRAKCVGNNCFLTLSLSKGEGLMLGRHEDMRMSDV
jgi:hypothetical protein